MQHLKLMILDKIYIDVDFSIDFLQRHQSTIYWGLHCNFVALREIFNFYCPNMR